LIDAGVYHYAKHLGDPNVTEEDIKDPKNLWCYHKRESWIRYTPETWVEYPFQNHFYTINDNQVRIYLKKTNTKEYIKIIPRNIGFKLFLTTH
jgi:hypothetical protein